MRRLLGKGNPGQVGKPQPLKSGAAKAEPQISPGSNDRPVQPLAERLGAQPPSVDLPKVTGTVRARESAPHPSLLGQSMLVRGNLEAGEDLTIAGHLEGSLNHTAQHLVIDATGVVKANIRACNLRIAGRVEGDIHASESVQLQATAQVTGNIHTARLSIADGARFNGKVTMIEPNKA